MEYTAHPPFASQPAANPHPLIVQDDATLLVSAFDLQKLVLLPWNNAKDEQNMLKLLRDGTIAALLIDAPFVEYQAAVNCDMAVVSD